MAGVIHCDYHDGADDDGSENLSQSGRYVSLLVSLASLGGRTVKHPSEKTGIAGIFIID